MSITSQIQSANVADVPIEVLERRQKAMFLRRKGAGYREIAKALNVSVSTAHEDVKVSLEQLAAATREDAEMMRALELVRLDGMLLKLSAKVDRGEVASILASIKIMERRAKLYGLDGPIRVEHGGEIDQNVRVSNELRETLSPTEARQKLNELQRKIGILEKPKQTVFLTNNGG